MPITQSENYDYPVLGATTNDARLADVASVKNALVAIDAIIKDVATSASLDSTSKANAAQAASTPLSHVGSGDMSHALAVANGAAGFMSGVDKTKLDNLSGVNTGDQINISGNASSATILQTARTINGVSFNGSDDIIINAVDVTERIASSLLGVANGVATLDSSGLVVSTQLPSYVDDIIEAVSFATLPANGETGKIYVTIDDNKSYRWSGSVYVYITSGAVDSVAGKTGVVVLVKGDVGLSNVDNTSDANKPVSTAQAIANTAVQTNAATDASAKATAAQVAAIAASTPLTHAGSTGDAHGVATTGVAGFMSSADKTKLDAISGSNTGDETAIGIRTKLGISTLSGINTGDQTNITGNAATVTTNASLTGAITSIGNVSSLGSFTLAQLNTAVSDGDIVSTISPTIGGHTSLVGLGSFLPANTTIAAASGMSSSVEVTAQGSAGTAGAAFMTFHRPGAFAVHMGLDTDNFVKVGGYSMGAVSYKLWHEGSDGAGSGLDADLLDGQQGAYYQQALVSGTNIKTINGNSLIGSGDVTISSGEATSITAGSVYGYTNLTVRNISIGYQALTAMLMGNDNIAVGYRSLYSSTTSSSNVAVGSYTLYSNTAGINNVAIGSNTLQSNSTGSNNVAIGHSALSNNTSGDQNVAIGTYALGSNTTGRFNTALGVNSLFRNTTAIGNTAIGNNALCDNTIGNSNTALGGNSLSKNTTADNNTAVGFNSLAANTTGSYNTAIGTNSLFRNTTGASNTAIGFNSLLNNTIGGANTAIGNQSLTNNTTGSNNIAIGNLSLSANSTGSSNNAIGNNALSNNTNGTGNIALGNSALQNNSTGNHNVAVGLTSLFSNQTGTGNIAIGYQSLYNNRGNSNTAIGFVSLSSNTAGILNSAIGNNSLQFNTTGNSNVAVGSASLQQNSLGSSNTSVGVNSLTANSTGNQNVAVGYYSLTSNNTGVDNVAIGTNALYNNKGSTNTAIGTSAGSNITTGTNNICIGNNAQAVAVTSTNSITLGDTNITSLRCQVTTISALSDKRDKANIQDIGLGMSFIKTLNPVKYNWDRREWYNNGVSDGTKKKTEFDYGFIAQELKQAQEDAGVSDLGLVLEDNPDRLEATPGRLLPILVKALQEANVRIEKLETIISTLIK